MTVPSDPGSMDELVAEMLEDALAGFARLLLRHREFAVWLAARDGASVGVGAGAPESLVQAPRRKGV